MFGHVVSLQLDAREHVSTSLTCTRVVVMMLFMRLFSTQFRPLIQASFSTSQARHLHVTPLPGTMALFLTHSLSHDAAPDFECGSNQNYSLRRVARALDPRAQEVTYTSIAGRYRNSLPLVLTSQGTPSSGGLLALSSRLGRCHQCWP
jgi:hypothetical protein